MHVNWVSGKDAPLAHSYAARSQPRPTERNSSSRTALTARTASSSVADRPRRLSAGPERATACGEVRCDRNRPDARQHIRQDRGGHREPSSVLPEAGCTR